MGLNCRNVFLFKSVKLNYHYLWRDGLCLIWFHHVFMNDQETDLKYNFGTYLVKDDNLPSVIRRPGTYICTYTSYELLLVLLRVQIHKNFDFGWRQTAMRHHIKMGRYIPIWYINVNVFDKVLFRNMAYIWGMRLFLPSIKIRNLFGRVLFSLAKIWTIAYQISLHNAPC